MSLLNMVSLIFAILFGSVLSQKIGPFDLILKSLESCGKPTDGAFMEPRVRKYNRTVFSVDVNVTLNSEFDDSVKGMMALSVGTNNGWKDNFFKYEFAEICKLIKQWVWGFIVRITKYGNLPAACPIKKGNYWVKNFPLAIDVGMVPAFQYNKYKYKITMTKNNRPYLCIHGMVDVVPKRKH